MTQETLQDLADNSLIGFTSKRGHAWWDRSGVDSLGRPNHFADEVPMDRVHELFRAEVISVPLTVTIPELITSEGVTPERVVTDPDRQVIVNSETGAIYYVASDSYVIHQYREWLVTNVENLLDDELKVGSAGLFMQGGIGYVQIELPETHDAPGGFEYRPFLMATTSMNGKVATTYTRGFTAVVCDNTHRMALNERGAQHIRVKHTRNSLLRLADARSALGLIITSMDEVDAEVERLLNVKVDDVQWQKIVEALAPIEEGASQRSVTMATNKIGELNRLYKNDVRAATWRGTGLGVMQAVNTYEQHLAVARNLGDGNKAQARYDRSLMAAVDGSLDKQAATVNELLASICS